MFYTGYEVQIPVLNRGVRWFSPKYCVRPERADSQPKRKGHFLNAFGWKYRSVYSARQTRLGMTTMVGISMSEPRSERIDKTEPALVVRHGNTSKRWFALTRNGMALGRAHGCDIQLESPEVSGLHCILTRAPGELAVRDCNSRVGTRVNGQKVREAVLRNGDMLQIGTFSFEVYVPWANQPQEVAKDPLEIYKRRVAVLEKSRDRLARLALKIRRRLHDSKRLQDETKVMFPQAERPTAIDRRAPTIQDRTLVVQV